MDDGGQEHPIAYLSKKLLPRQSKYPTIERECLALVWAIQKLHPYLYVVEFTLQTDHNPLKWLHSVQDMNQKLLNWSLMLLQNTFTVEHRAGVDNRNAGGLSRTY